MRAQFSLRCVRAYILLRAGVRSCGCLCKRMCNSEFELNALDYTMKKKRTFMSEMFKSLISFKFIAVSFTQELESNKFNISYN